MKKIVVCLFGVLFLTQCKPTQEMKPQQTPKSDDQITVDSAKTAPRLIVGIVVDQMRYDYLTRFWKKYGDEGFKRLITDGYNLKNTHYNYVPTYTAPGHSSIYTGTSPRFNGIISNHWYDKISDRSIYCVSDDDVTPVGTSAEAGKMSPKRLLSSTVSDENRLATQFRGKTIGVALKDRAAILPAGRNANAAYWFYGKDEGRFVTSSYYRNQLPQWVKDFNASGKAQSYIKPWKTLYPIGSYTESGADVNDYEAPFKGMDNAKFPYDLEALKDDHYGYSILKRVPFGNDLTTDFALAALDGEALGQDDDTDFLTISYSATDYIGHQFGVNSKEAEDTYLRLDKSLARLLNALDKKVGQGKYTIFLTADHGGVNVPAYLRDRSMAAGYFSTKQLRKKIKNYIGSIYGTTDLIKTISNKQVFFNYKKLDQKHIQPDELAGRIQHFLQNYPKIAQIYTRKMIEGGAFNGIVSKRVKNGFNPKRSGDVVYVLEPGVISYSHTGSTHGSPYSYDTHVPLIFYGQGINTGQTTRHRQVVDIAPTVSALLNIPFPNATTGRVLSEVIE